MTARLFQRLRQMDGRELRDRAGAAARQARDRVRLRVRGSAWQRRDIGRVLSPAFQERPGLRALVDAGDWTAIHRVLFEHYAQAPQRARFLPGLQSMDETRTAIAERFPDAVQDARRTAERLLDGTIDVLGYRALRITDPGGDIDWHLDPVNRKRPPVRFWATVPYLDPDCGDHKVIWEINRHQHWLRLGRAAWLTGETRFTSEIVRQLESWLRQNPPLVGVNWASMLELAFRSLSWVWALALCTGRREPDTESEPWTIDLLIGLDSQLEHVRLNLSRYFSPNTHLLGEALALYVVGRLLPELAQAERWADVGRQVLLAERARQVHADGGHAELSPHYHRYVLDFYLVALMVARASSDGEAQRAFEDTAGMLARYMRAICDDRGRMPLIGDDDGGQTFPVCERQPSDAASSLACAAALLNEPQLAVDHLTEEAIWLAGPRARISRILPSPEPPADRSRISLVTFPDTGYRVARTSNGDHLVFDAGVHGFLNGGHAHADALQIVLTLRSRPLLIDPGTFTYTMSPEARDRFRSTRMHNTLVLDGRGQSEPAGPFHWRTRTDARAWFDGSCDRAAWFEAQHEGYSPVIHRRGVLLLDDGACIVLDHLIGDGDRPHEAAVNWHLAPDWTASVAADGVVALTSSDGVVWHLSSTADLQVVRGDADGLGWHAPVYGQIVPASTITATAAGACPVTIATLIVPEGTRPGLRVRRIDREDEIGVVLDIDTDRGARRVISWTELRGPAQAQVDEWSVDGVTSHERIAVVDRSAAEPAPDRASGDAQLELAPSLHVEAP